MKTLRFILALLAALILCFLAGCELPQPQQGGSAALGAVATLQQGENAAAASRQEHSRSFERSYTVPAGAELVSWSESGLSNLVRISQPIVVLEREITGGKTELGASQKDTAREIGAKLASMRPVQWAGIALCVGSVAAFYFGWPSLGFLAIAVGGGMITAAAIIPGRETFILVVGGMGLAVVALAVVYAYSKGKLDQDGNGKIDLLERKPA